MSPRLRSILVFVVSAVVLLYYNLRVNADYFWGDERAFTTVGERWVSGLLESEEPNYYISSYTLQRTSDSPPMSKVITGIFYLLLSRIGDEQYPVPIRIHSSLFLAGVCTISYLIGRKLADELTGLVAWSLLLFQPIIQPNGPEIALSSLDITCLLFMSISIYFLINPKQPRNILISGIFFGFATLSKYIAFVILPPFFFAWILAYSGSLKESIKLGTILFFIGLIVHLPLNPYLTEPTLRNAMIYWQFREGNAFFKWASSEIPLVQSVLSGKDLDRAIVRFMIRIFTLPTELFLDYYLVQLLVVTMVYACWKRTALSQEEILPFFWFSFSFLFMQVHSKHFPYYDIILFPGLALFVSIFWRKRGLTVRRRIDQTITGLFSRHGHAYIPNTSIRWQADKMSG